MTASWRAHRPGPNALPGCASGVIGRPVAGADLACGKGTRVAGPAAVVGAGNDATAAHGNLRAARQDLLRGEAAPCRSVFVAIGRASRTCFPNTPRCIGGGRVVGGIGSVGNGGRIARRHVHAGVSAASGLRLSMVPSMRPSMLPSVDADPSGVPAPESGSVASLEPHEGAPSAREVATERHESALRAIRVTPRTP